MNNTTLANAQATETPKKTITQFILNLLYTSLIISALIGIGAIIFGNDEYGDKATGTIGLLILVDLLLLYGLLPKNPFFRYSIWINTVIAFAFTTLSLWIPRPFNDGMDYSDTYPYEIIPRPKGLAEVFQGIGSGLWLILTTLVILSLISLAEPLIKKAGKIAVGFYWALIAIAITGTLPLAFAIALSRTIDKDYDIFLKIYASAFILSSTIFFILAISIVHNLLKNYSKTRLENQKRNLNAMNSPQQSFQAPHNNNAQQSQQASPQTQAPQQRAPYQAPQNQTQQTGYNVQGNQPHPQNRPENNPAPSQPPFRAPEQQRPPYSNNPSHNSENEPNNNNNGNPNT